MRIGLVSDREGDVVALEAALAGLKRHTPDVMMHAGDILCCPFSPDPPSETVALLKAQAVLVIPGNHNRFPDGRELQVVRGCWRGGSLVGYAVLTGGHGIWSIEWRAQDIGPRRPVLRRAK